MLNLHWELSVLTRSVAYGNLSGAALHVGLSQPQLSRIVSRIESELHVVLLDRAARRKSGWTPTAFRLAEVYSQSSRKLDTEINKLVKMAEPTHLRAATLEGLSVLASSCCHRLMTSSSIRVIELDVHDLNRLEEVFVGGELDLIFTSREPTRRKFKHIHELGFQSVERVGSNPSMRVLSSFEYGTQSAAEPTKDVKTLVSNSLDVRRGWIQKFGGQGEVPSEVRRKPGKGDKTVVMIGADGLSEQVWKQLTASMP